MKATMAWRCRACDGFMERLLVCSGLSKTIIWEAFGGKARDWARFGKKLDKNTTILASDFHSDAFTKSVQKVKFLIKVVTSQVMEMALEVTPNSVKIKKRQRHHEVGGGIHSEVGGDEREFVVIEEVGRDLYGGGEGGDLLEDDIKTLRRSEGCIREVVIEMKKNDVYIEEFWERHGVEE
ncbi:hypothetical protein Tco_1176660 [Tanacetum coccineum]